MSTTETTALPGQTITLTESGIPTGSTVGFQVLKAAGGSIVIGRTTIGTTELPVGSGNFVIAFVAPVEGDLYLVVIDWTGGVLAPATTRVQELQVQGIPAGSGTGLGAVADYAKTYLGGESWALLTNSVNYGSSAISRAIESMKARVFKVPPTTVNEAALPGIVLAYLGVLAALELIPATRDAWVSMPQSKSVGNDPVEVITYASRDNMLDKLAASLVTKAREMQRIAIPLIDGVRLFSVTTGPSIDEEDDKRVTNDPRTFPTETNFPYDFPPWVTGTVFIP